MDHMDEKFSDVCPVRRPSVGEALLTTDSEAGDLGDGDGDDDDHDSDIDEETASQVKDASPTDVDRFLAPVQLPNICRDKASQHQMMMLEASRAFESLLEEQTRQEENQSKRSRCIINPDRPSRLAWDLVALVAIMYQAVTVPYELSFSVDGGPHGEVCIYNFASGSDDLDSGCVLGALNLIVDLFFATDIMLNFMTGFYYKGTLIMIPHRCFVQYLRSWFVVDALGIFPWRYISAGEDQSDAAGAAKLLRMLKFLKFVRLLKLLRVMKLRALLVKVEDHLRSEYLYVVFQLLKLSVYLLLLCHITACAWHGVAMLAMQFRGLDDDFHKSWVEEAGLHVEGISNGERYICALYFTMATMTTVGYGDISAGSFPLERGFASFTLLMGTGVFTMLITSIAKSFQGSAAAGGTGGPDMNRAALKYLWKTGVSGELTVQIRKYLQQHQESSMDLATDEYLRENISQTLLHKFCVESFSNVLKRFDFFEACSSELLGELCRICKRVRCSPGEVLCVEGDTAEAMYFILQGKVLEIRAAGTTGQEITPELHEGMHFGEGAIFEEHPTCHASAVCRFFTELVKVPLHDLHQFARHSTELTSRISARKWEMQEHLQQLAKMGRARNGYESTRLATKCTLCDRMGHITEECPIKGRWDNATQDLLLGCSKSELRPWWSHVLVRLPTVPSWFPSKVRDWQKFYQRRRRRMQIFGVKLDLPTQYSCSDRKKNVRKSMMWTISRMSHQSTGRSRQLLGGSSKDRFLPTGSTSTLENDVSGPKLHLTRKSSQELEREGLPDYYNSGDAPKLLDCRLCEAPCQDDAGNREWDEAAVTFSEPLNSELSEPLTPATPSTPLPGEVVCPPASSCR